MVAICGFEVLVSNGMRRRTSGEAGDCTRDVLPRRVDVLPKKVRWDIHAISRIPDGIYAVVAHRGPLNDNESSTLTGTLTLLVLDSPQCDGRRLFKVLLGHRCIHQFSVDCNRSVSPSISDIQFPSLVRETASSFSGEMHNA